MESKEALKTILINCKDLLVDKNGNVVKLEDLIKIIKQDLERLGKLEEENKQLRNELHSIYCYGTSQAKQDLLEENEKLKQKLDYINSLSYSMPPYYKDIIKEVLENE